MTETISAIMPARNSAHTIEASLQSVVEQSRLIDELVLIDDQSTDGTAAVARKFMADSPIRLTVLQGQGKGPAIARNLGIKAAAGSAICFLDADDLWPQHKIAFQVERLQGLPKVDIVGGYCRNFEQQAQGLSEPASGSPVFDRCFVNLGIYMMRRSVFDQIGYLDESFLYSEDVDFSLRFREAEVPIAVLNAVMLYYRRHPGQMTEEVTPREKSDYCRSFFNSVRRRKQLGGAMPKELRPLEDFLEPCPGSVQPEFFEVPNWRRV